MLMMTNGSSTLATALKAGGFIEAACDEQLSFATCACAKVATFKGSLPDLTADEEDVVELEKSVVEGARAACQIPLESGEIYTVWVDSPSPTA